jgi:hypothetical protein
MCSGCEPSWRFQIVRDCNVSRSFHVFQKNGLVHLDHCVAFLQANKYVFWYLSKHTFACKIGGRWFELFYPSRTDCDIMWSTSPFFSHLGEPIPMVFWLVSPVLPFARTLLIFVAQSRFLTQAVTSK